MSAITGIAALVDYSAIGDNRAKIQALMDLIPDPDTTNTSGAQAGGGFLDEISPVAAVGLRVEIAALKAAIEEGVGDAYAFGSHVVSAGEATANQADIVTGLADITIANCVVDVKRAGVTVKADAVVTEPVAGTIRVADGAATYNMTAGDVITWAAQ